MRLYEDNFWGRVKSRLAANGMTVKKLCELTGYNYTTMTNQITISRTPKDHDAIERIAQVLGCSVEYLVVGQSDPVKYTPEIENLIANYIFLSPEKQQSIQLIMESFVNQQIADNRKITSLVEHGSKIE